MKSGMLPGIVGQERQGQRIQGPQGVHAIGVFRAGRVDGGDCLFEQRCLACSKLARVLKMVRSLKLPGMALLRPSRLRPVVLSRTLVRSQIVHVQTLVRSLESCEVVMVGYGTE